MLYPVLDNAPETGRGDIAAILLTGVPGLNFTGTTQADLIRLNTGIAPSAPVGAGNRLGVLGGDFAGFPNGRRLEDDVTDIELRALTCGYGPTVGPLIESLGIVPGTRTARRTTSSATGWTRTTVRSGRRSRTSRSRTRATSTSITPRWVGRKPGGRRRGPRAAAGPSVLLEGTCMRRRRLILGAAAALVAATAQPRRGARRRASLVGAGARGARRQPRRQLLQRIRRGRHGSAGRPSSSSAFRANPRDAEGPRPPRPRLPAARPRDR